MLKMTHLPHCFSVATMVIYISEFFNLHGKMQSMESAKDFRDNVVAKALRTHSTVEVDLNNVDGYSLTWLEEVFGGLVRSGFSEEWLIKHMKIISHFDNIVSDCWDYVHNEYFTKFLQEYFVNKV